MSGRAWTERLNYLLNWAYFVCYRLGSWTMLVFLVTGRFLSRGASRLSSGLGGFFRRLPKRLLRGLIWVAKELTSPAAVLVHAALNVRKHVRAARSRSPREGMMCAAASVPYLVIQLLKSVVYLLNYLAPALGVLVLIMTVHYFSGVEYALSIKYDGARIGYVRDLSVFDDAETELDNRLASIEMTRADIKPGAVTYSVVFVPKTELSTANALANELIQKSFSDLTVAYGVYVDGRYWGAIEDGPALQTYLDDRLAASANAMTSVPTVDVSDLYDDPYQDAEEDEEDGEDAENGENEEPDDGELDTTPRMTGEVSARYLRDIRIQEGYYPAAGLVDSAPMYETFESLVSGEQVYVIEEGDSPWTVALKLDNVTLEELYAMNPWMEDGNLYPGDEVIIAKEVPFLEVELTVGVVYNEEITPEMEKEESDKYYVGYAQVTDSGTPGEKEIRANIVYQNGIEIDRQVIGERVVVEPVPGKMLVGTQERSKGGASSSPYGESIGGTRLGSGSFMWPVDGGKFSCGYGGYAGHYGMDITAKAGTNIRAADGGVVVVSVRNDSIGYGNYVVIDHGNGVKTLYAHCSARYVTAGQYVQKGDVIAAVGETGWAYGNHLHFEVQINGRKVNPANYIGYGA